MRPFCCFRFSPGLLNHINTTLVQERDVVDLFNVALSAIAVLVAIINLVTVTCMQRCALIQRLVCCRKHNDSAAQRCSARCPGCNSLFMNLDLSPILLSEIFIFPVFICAMFQFLLALKKSNNQFDLAVIRGTVIFILTSLFTLFVYFLRTLNFALAFRAIQKVRGRRYNGEASRMLSILSLGRSALFNPHVVSNHISSGHDNYRWQSILL